MRVHLSALQTALTQTQTVLKPLCNCQRPHWLDQGWKWKNVTIRTHQCKILEFALKGELLHPKMISFPEPGSPHSLLWVDQNKLTKNINGSDEWVLFTALLLLSVFGTSKIYRKERHYQDAMLYLFVATYPPCVIQMGTFIQISTFKYDFFHLLLWRGLFDVPRFPSGAPLTICLQNILLMLLRKGSSVCLLRTGRY
jgi:hypothetical protein